MAISTYLKMIKLAGRLAAAETLFLFCLSARAGSQRSLISRPSQRGRWQLKLANLSPRKPCMSLMRAPSPDIKVQVKRFMLLSPYY